MFPLVLDGVLPRKTSHIGEADEKRFDFEAEAILACELFFKGVVFFFLLRGTLRASTCVQPLVL